MAYCTRRPADCPAQRSRWLELFVSRGAMDIDRVGEKLLRVADAGRPGQRPGRPLQADQGAACRARADGRQERPERAGLDRGQQAAPALPADLGAQHPPRRREGGPAAGGALRLARRACMAASEEDINEIEGHRPDHRRRASSSTSPTRSTATSSSACGRPASASWTSRRRQCDGEDGPLSGKSFVVTGRLQRATRTADRGADQGAGRQRHGQRDQEDRATWSSARTPARSWRRPRSSGPRILDEDAFEALAEGREPVPAAAPSADGEDAAQPAALTGDGS